MLLGCYWLWQSNNSQQADTNAAQTKLSEGSNAERAAWKEANSALQSELKEDAIVFKKEQQRLTDKINEMGLVEEYRRRIKEAAELVTHAEQRLVLTADGAALL